MWINTTEGREFILELSQSVVAEVAPEELPLFAELAQEYLDDPSPPDLAAPANNEPLGFGLEEILVAVTPAAMAMTSSALTYVLAEVIKATQAESAAVIKSKIKTLFNAKEKSHDPPPLTPEQLDRVRKLARKQARSFGMNADQAERMVDALIGRLVMGS